MFLVLILYLSYSSFLAFDNDYHSTRRSYSLDIGIFEVRRCLTASLFHCALDCRATPCQQLTTLFVTNSGRRERFAVRVETNTDTRGIRVGYFPRLLCYHKHDLLKSNRFLFRLVTVKATRSIIQTSKFQEPTLHYESTYYAATLYFIDSRS